MKDVNVGLFPQAFGKHRRHKKAGDWKLYALTGLFLTGSGDR